MAHDDRQLVLPALAVSPGDVRRLKREVEALDDYIHQSELRKTGEATAKLPRTSRMLDELAAANKLNLLETAQRAEAQQFLDRILNSAPVVHMSFSADPSSAFLVKIITWFRANIRQDVLVSVGLQPSIAVGFVMKTPNHYYDFSLRQRFSDSRKVLVDKVRSLQKTTQE
jgi:F0F1-type ATP synthase delta subunit